MTLFKMGKLVATSGAIAFCDKHSINIISLVRRHLRGDWGDLDAEDKASNDEAVQTEDARILSMYQFRQGKIWIITEADRSSTCVLLPDEYSDKVPRPLPEPNSSVLGCFWRQIGDREIGLKWRFLL